jgi:hypothetical protein
MGQKLKGVILFISAVSLALLGIGALSIIILLYAVIDSYNTATKINKGLEEEYGQYVN